MTLKDAAQNRYVQTVVVLVVGVAIGRYTLPARIETKIETQIVEKVVVQKERQKQTDKVTVVTETLHPDGTLTKRTEIIDKSQISSETNKQTDTSAKSTETKVVEYSKRFGVEVGILTSGGVYTHATADIFGPFFVGAQVQLGSLLNSNSPSPTAAGVGLGIRF